jgi:hypothetical protein
MDTRSLLRQSVHLETAMQLILSRTQKVTGASGAALCVAENGTAEYRAGTGAGINLAGLRFPEAECPFFARVRAHPAVEWGDLEEPKAKQRIVGSFELRTPICCKGRLVGCLKLFSQIRQFGTETIHICELMAVFLGQLLEDQGPSVSGEPAGFWRSQSDPPTEAAPREATSLRLVVANREQPLAQGFSFEEKRSTPLVAQETKSRGPLATNSTVHQRSFDPCEFEGEQEQLPTMDELLQQLGAAIQQGSLPELHKPVSRPTAHAGNVSSDKPTVTLSTAHMTRNLSAAETGDATEGIEQVTPEKPEPNSDKRGPGRRHGLGNAAPFIFPVFVLVFGVTLNITQTSLGMAFQLLTLTAIVFSVIEIWRAGYGDR